MEIIVGIAIVATAFGTGAFSNKSVFAFTVFSPFPAYLPFRNVSSQNLYADVPILNGIMLIVVLFSCRRQVDMN